MAKQRKAENLAEVHLSPSLLLLTDDQALADLIAGIVKLPWKLVCLTVDRRKFHEMFAKPNVRLVILDDQTVEENERSWLLAQLRQHFSGTPLLYVAGIQTDGNEKRARTNGAQYYVSRPLSLERFRYVLRSFLSAQELKGHDGIKR